jgi:hypothetical protein
MQKKHCLSCLKIAGRCPENAGCSRQPAAILNPGIHIEGRLAMIRHQNADTMVLAQSSEVYKYCNYDLGTE